MKNDKKEKSTEEKQIDMRELTKKQLIGTWIMIIFNSLRSPLKIHDIIFITVWIMFIIWTARNIVEMNNIKSMV